MSNEVRESHLTSVGVGRMQEFEEVREGRHGRSALIIFIPNGSTPTKAQLVANQNGEQTKALSQAELFKIGMLEDLKLLCRDQAVRGSSARCLATMMVSLRLIKAEKASWAIIYKTP
jgi:hypothetical protein